VDDHGHGSLIIFARGEICDRASVIYAQTVISRELSLGIKTDLVISKILSLMDSNIATIRSKTIKSIQALSSADTAILSQVCSF
jgi:hypothetical protein